MKNVFKAMALAMVAAVVLYGCTSEEITNSEEVSPAMMALITDAGFDVLNQAPIVFEEGYLIEGDIYLTEAQLREMSHGHRIPAVEQYSTNNLVTTGGSRNITIYAPTGRRGFSAGMLAGFDEAIARYNAENLEITFTRISTNNADITVSRLKRRDERQGVLGSAGFPTSSGDPFGSIQMSGILESSFGLSTDGIATIFAHELGHCIGFRHTDYFDRSISCGGGTANEGDAGIGANLIPGTPAGASLADASWMLACTDGSDRPFNADDQVALDFLY